MLLCFVEFGEKNIVFATGFVNRNIRAGLAEELTTWLDSGPRVQVCGPGQVN